MVVRYFMLPYPFYVLASLWLLSTQAGLLTKRIVYNTQADSQYFPFPNFNLVIAVAQKVTYFMVATYIFNCMRIRTKPCKYFQLNSPIFNAREGIFSKLEIDQLIPQKWRLPQDYDDGETIPESFPVFVKPEWGQNANGIYRAANEADLLRIRKEISHTRIKYLIQQAASEKQEFEVFYMRHDRDQDRYAHLTITQAVNDAEPNPINGVNNANTCYREITDQFSQQQKTALWNLLSELGRFNISRIGLRADSVDDMLAGSFHIIEINLFIPMPINMLDSKHDYMALWRMVREYMMSLARLTKARNKALETKPVFTKIMLYNRSNPLLNFIRDRI